MINAVRKITNCKNRKKTGYFPSIKMNRIIMFESLLERDYIHLLEFDSDVVSYSEQPLRIEYIANNRKYSYTPDFLVERRSKTQISEVKPKSILEKIICDEKKIKKYIAADNYCKQKLYEFIFVTDDLIREGYMLKNIKMLFMFSRVDIPYSYKKNIEFELRNINRIKISEIINLLSKTLDEPIKYKQYIFSMIYRNIIKTDINKKIIDDSIIWI